MRLLINFLIAYTTLMCCHVSGLDEEHRAAYDRLVECLSLGTGADVPESRTSHVPVAKVMCDAFKAMDPCLIKPLDSPGAKTEILDFYRAYQLQRVLIANKAHMCAEPLAYQELKKLVDESEIMKNENLPSVEEDDYVACEGEISMTCYKAADNAWLAGGDNLRVFRTFIECYGQESENSPDCDFPIVHHMNTVVQAFKKHLIEKHGLLGGMIKEIK